MAEVVLRNIKKSFGPVDIIKGVDIDINDKEFVVFVGPSGCGKSTLLRMIAGLESISDGELSIDGKRVNDLSPADRGIAMVFQTYALYPHMTVRDNMGFSLKLAKVPKAEIDRKVNEAARILKLDPLMDRKPKALSGGQRQRVAIGRAIVRNPKVFLFDEPLSNLDAALRVQMRIEIARMHSDFNATMIYVTHDQVEAMTMADKIVVLQGGVVEQVGSPLELYHHPANRFVAGFIGSPTMNFIDATVKAVAPEGVTVELPGGDNLTVLVVPGATKAGDKLTLGVRPEHLQEGSGDGKLTGTALVVERLGGATYAYVKLDNGTMITAEVDGNSHIRVNDPIQLGVRSQTCHLFGSDGLALAQSTRHPLADVGRGKGGH
ncbi:bifunctional: maltose transport protein (ABC superfamily, atp_bind) (N-terminal); phenotypic repressor of mal operon (C-terminal) [Candidatus Competibacter denitrificans Run_A_D11]|uniref:Bifunctional: maltose transport protein (ABC superfamily, atp_bind) (N-terminal) phenotypic repressor of mal operon (C-terminal) n=1 Tax=Candidatus Competibacter denitrificans Run_A_D11 TaxID=1400863 RepID=W6MDH3_9GAMM|nr:sn-glycerol-3-phosphate ABC transporter ATP-binding protein UgpC [Candidatus Competibacter denitrificans]CDI02863.1 bifunctional: maltose transport protein (ABC superfamily, atp_bind) (N-terminal); phenotypic repressor of mal operon (C-terminal) [Candidatus Competibacter denitrificans Run_A_D11]